MDSLFIPDDDVSTQEIPWNFWMGLSKSLATEIHHGAQMRCIEGIAATEDLDQQRESLLLDGMDFSPFTKSGWINWNHQEGPEFLVGKPLEACIKGMDDGRRGFYVKAALLNGHPKADAVWSLLESLEKSGWNDRVLGWSVQGGVLLRQGHRLSKSVVRHVALSHEPVNGTTFAQMAKSLTKTLFMGPALVPTLADGTTGATGGSPPPDTAMNPGTGGPMTPTLYAHPTPLATALKLQNMSPTLTSVLWGDCLNPEVQCYDSTTGEFRKGIFGALDHLTICKGHSVQEGKYFLFRLHQSGLLTLPSAEE